MLKRILSIFVSISLLNTQVFASIEVIDRNSTTIANYLYNANPTDLPYAEYNDNFIHQMTKLIDQLNLSQYEGKYIYIGYGVFDKNNNYCKYVELPTLSPETNSADNVYSIVPPNFDQTTEAHYNNHTYAKSRQKMTYKQCLELTNKFGGYPVVVTSRAEDVFLKSKMGNDYWLGITRKNCDSLYINVLNYNQEYNPFLHPTGINEYPPVCNSSKLNLVVNYLGKWNDASSTETHYCVMEVDSPDINRPLKICAPWWRIERTYEINDSDSLDMLAGGIKLNQINQADIPQSYTVCTQYDANATAALQEASPREVTCTQYYQATAAPECIRNPYQPQCFINECEGYIENACTLVDTLIPYKDYTKTQVKLNGVLTWIKDKQSIKTLVYQCPPSLPSIKKCKKQELVLVWPKECPGSQCEAQKECILNNQADEETCKTKYPCKKIYPNLDLTDASCYDVNGNLIKLKGKCNDGTVLDFPINIQNRVDKKCIEYEEENITKLVHETCTLERQYSDHTVDMSITDEDAYENNPKCIRINNIIDSRPRIDVSVDYESFGTSSVNVKKAYINEDNKELGATPKENYVPNPSDIATNQKAFYEGTYGVIIDSSNVDENETVPSTETMNCDFTDSWLSKIQQYTQEPDIVSIEPVASDNTNVVKTGHEGDMVLKFNNINSALACNNKKNDVKGNDYYYSAADKYCEVYVSQTDTTLDNRFEKISVYNGVDGQTWYSKNLVDKETCDEWAACLGAAYNKEDYPADASVAQCIIDTGGTYEDVEEPSNVPTEAGKICSDLPHDSGTIITDINGLKDIFVVTDETSGVFGFFSNYVRKPYKDSIAKINGKEVLPIIPVAHIRDDQIKYYYNIIQYSILTKSPNIVAGFVAGGAVGGASAAWGSMGWYALGPAAIAGLLAAAIFGKKTKLNRQQELWIVYKMVQTQIRNINNYYGYDERIFLPYDFDDNKQVIPGTFNNAGKTYYAMVYLAFGVPMAKDSSHFNDPIRVYKYSDTGTMKPGDFKNLLRAWKDMKIKEFHCAGFDEVPVPLISAEEGVVVGYPHCKWYQLSCNKTKSKSWSGYKDLFKDMTNYYKGATNTVSIVVPYIGDYEVKAFDKNGNQLGDIIVREGDFIPGGANKANYAQLMFGINMDLADGVTEGTNTNACRYDNMVEWGGGVSGIYYENDYTGLYKGCQKSNDQYVSDHSATYFRVRPLNQDKWYVVKLNKPLPFANRVFLVTLGQKEIRKYRCYEDFGECSDSDYEVTGGE